MMIPLVAKQVRFLTGRSLDLFLLIISLKVATLRNETIEIVVEATTRNFETLFLKK